MASNSRTINYLTVPARVSMADFWYEAAHVDHFWICRRFEVMRYLADAIIRQAGSIGEIGCGNGLVQWQFEEYYGVSVAGFDLNELALKKNQSRTSPLYCYDIHQRSLEFRAGFDLLLLLDVLEHIEDEKSFLESVKYHLAASGRILLNVPAHRFFFSAYDRAAGHFRRYSQKHLERVVTGSGFRISHLTYWGAPLIPLLMLRKAVVGLQRDEQGVVSTGFALGSPALNSWLMILSRFEMLPQKFAGTSLMAVLERAV
jgi:SAM-dependent methyltransferase